MPRYYFHYQDDTFFEDEEGEHFGNADQARGHARQLALELAQGGEQAGRIVVATDSRPLFEIPLPRWLQ